MDGLTVGQVAERFGITVRTLHHYDEIGLLIPSRRMASGYRVYTSADLTRLSQVIVYRRLKARSGQVLARGRVQQHGLAAQLVVRMAQYIVGSVHIHHD